MALKDEIKPGDKFNYLTVIELFSEVTIRKCGSKQTIWKARCRCECGNEKNIILGSLKRGTTKSCGCYNQKLRKSRVGKNNPNSNKYSIDHPLYQSWKAMKTKCDNPNSQGYIGASYLKEWETYDNFYIWAINYWKEKTYLSRLDQNKGFYPENCCFRTKKEIAQLTKNNPEKTKQTSLERYGVESYTKTQEYLEKTKKTSLEKYGVKHHTQAESVKEKICQTNLDRYGTECVLANNEQEKNLGKWLTKISNLNFSSNWKILNGKQIDLYNDDLKLGIEYCGLIWHSEYRGKDKNYHYLKYKKCEEQNIRLITIFADEYLYRNKQVKNFLKSVLSYFNKRIFARKCIVQKIDKKLAQTFIEDNHIQGKTNSIVYFGLLYKQELVGCISLRKHHRNNKDLVLDRLCFKDEIQVVGGASKLINQCEKWAIQNNYDKIISWSDNRWSIGTVYKKTGFILDKELKPDYSYIKIKNPKKRKSKQSMKKKNIGCPDNVTELEWTKQLGYSRIWDCGKKRWIKKINADK